MRRAIAVAAVSLALAACERAPSSPSRPPEVGTSATATPSAATSAAPAAPSPAASDTAGVPEFGIPVLLQGSWGMVSADCTSTRGDAKGLLRISSTTLTFYESLGRLGVIKERSENAIRADFAFSGEGMNWRRDVTLTAKGDKLVRSERGGEEPGSAGPFTYTRC